MNIKNTSEYLDLLDSIAQLKDQEKLSENDRNRLLKFQKAVRKYELRSVNQYPASKVLVANFQQYKWNLN